MNTIEIEIAVARRTNKVLFQGVTQPANQPKGCVKGLGRLSYMSENLIISMEDGRGTESQLGDTVEFFMDYEKYKHLSELMDEGVEVLNLDGSKSKAVYTAAVIKAKVNKVNNGWIKVSKVSQEGVIITSLGNPKIISYEPQLRDIKGTPVSKYSNINKARENAKKEAFLASQSSALLNDNLVVTPELLEIVSPNESVPTHAQVNADINLEHLSEQVANMILQRLALVTQ